MQLNCSPVSDAPLPLLLLPPHIKLPTKISLLPSVLSSSIPALLPLMGFDCILNTVFF